MEVLSYRPFSSAFLTWYIISFKKPNLLKTKVVSPSILPLTLLSPQSSSNQTQTVLSRKPLLTWMNLTVYVSVSVSIQCSNDFMWLSRNCSPGKHLLQNINGLCQVLCSTAACTLVKTDVWTACLFNDRFICCGIFYDRMLKQRLIFFSLQRRPVLITTYFLYFSLCLGKHWPWLTLVWCFWKACLSEIWHWWPFTNHCWASKECISFYVFVFLNQWISASFTAWIEKSDYQCRWESMRNDQKPNAGWFLCAVSSFCTK